MKDFFITFGQRYRREIHPHGGHPDGWVRVLAETYEQAQEKAMAKFGPLWANLYEADDFDKSFHPKGELGVIE